MKKPTLFLVITLVMFNLSCEKKEDCPQVEGFCITPLIYIELIDKNTGENLFTNGTYDRHMITFVDKNNDAITWSLYHDDFFTFLNCNLGNDLINNYTMKVSGEKIFTIYIDAVQVYEECRSWTQVNEERIESEYESELVDGVHTILIE